MQEIKRGGRERDAWSTCKVGAMYAGSVMAGVFALVFFVALVTTMIEPASWVDAENVFRIGRGLGAIAWSAMVFSVGRKSKKSVGFIPDFGNDGDGEM